MSDWKAIKVGDLLKDNDPRSAHRGLLVVKGILPNGIIARDSLDRYRTYLSHRLHADGKPRRSGLSLVKKDPAQ